MAKADASSELFKRSHHFSGIFYFCSFLPSFLYISFLPSLLISWPLFFFNPLLTFSLLPLTSPAASSPFFLHSPCHQCPLLIDGSFTPHWREAEPEVQSQVFQVSDGVGFCFLALFFPPCNSCLFGKHLFFFMLCVTLVECWSEIRSKRAIIIIKHILILQFLSPSLHVH